MPIPSPKAGSHFITPVSVLSPRDYTGAEHDKTADALYNLGLYFSRYEEELGHACEFFDRAAHVYAAVCVAHF